MLRAHQRRNQRYLRSQSYPKIIARQAALQTKSTPHSTQLMSEIKIHESLQHQNIVKFLHNFEDNLNVYIVLELCPNKVPLI